MIFVSSDVAKTCKGDSIVRRFCFKRSVDDAGGGRFVHSVNDRGIRFARGHSGDGEGSRGRRRRRLDVQGAFVSVESRRASGHTVE